VAPIKETLERELKLSAGRGFKLPDLPGEPLPPRVFTSTYFDSEDLRLARLGVTLRRRVERRRGLWQLKLPRGAARLELEVPGGPSGPPPELRELLTAFLRRAELRPVAKLRTRRAGVCVWNGEGPAAEVTVDAVSVIEDRHVVRSFREIEAELLNDDEQILKHIEKTLQGAGARKGDGRPKVFRALDLDRPAAPAPPHSSAPTRDHLQAMLERQYFAILAHDPGTRLGEDSEELHQMRVATRRLRAFLRAARPLLDLEWAESLRLELAWLGSALGPVRDLDVLIEHLHDEAAGLEPREQRALGRLFALLETERAEARAAMLVALRSDRYVDLLDRLEAAVAEPRLVESELSVREIAAHEFRRLRKAVRRLEGDPTDEQLHAIRIRGKRARYAAELAESTVGKRAARFIAEAKLFQDVLGDHQDAVVAEERIRTLGRRAGGSVVAFAAGRLVERERARRLAARAAFPDGWARLKKRGNAAWR
jgi:CHAD domain-containing protein